jgi:hypothetical protein
LPTTGRAEELEELANGLKPKEGNNRRLGPAADIFFRSGFSRVVVVASYCKLLQVVQVVAVYEWKAQF